LESSKLPSITVIVPIDIVVVNMTIQIGIWDKPLVLSWLLG